MSAEPQPVLENQALAASLQDARVTLPRVLGSREAITIVVGGVIGSGIFLVPRTVAQQLDSFGLALLVWVICGGLSLMGALTYAELGAMMPEAGGQYVYLREAYGRMCAFLTGWTDLLVARTGACAALAVAFALSLKQIIDLSSWTAKFIAVTTIVLLAVVNILGTRKGGHVQNVTTYIKASFLAVMALLPFVLGRAQPENWLPLFPPHADGKLAAAFGASMLAALWAYSGWDNLNRIAEEIEEPERRIPRALIVGVLIVIVLYLAANVAYHSLMPVAEVARAPHVAAAAMDRLLGPFGRTFISLVVMCSTFGGVNINLLAGPRIFFAMARDQLFFRFLREVHPRFGTPANAIVLQATWSIVLLASFGLFRDASELPELFGALIAFVVFGNSIFYTMAIAAVFVLRRKCPDLPRPYRTWGYPVVPMMSVITYTWLLVTTLINSPFRSGLGLVMIAAGIPVCWLWQRKAVPI